MAVRIERSKRFSDVIPFAPLDHYTSLIQNNFLIDFSLFAFHKLD